jgi:hypothetical protein
MEVRFYWMFKGKEHRGGESMAFIPRVGETIVIRELHQNFEAEVEEVKWYIGHGSCWVECHLKNAKIV